MYKHTTEAFGKFTKHIFFNEITNNGFSVVPEVGGTILEVWLEGQQIIDGCETAQELEDNVAYKSALLFPFPNRLLDGRYEHNGKEYRFPINDGGTNNALHGLGRDVEMDVLKKETKDTEASISLSYFEEGTNKSYPFPFLFDVIYSISDKGGFEVKMRFTNEANESIPVGIGWHPYFKIGDSINTASLKMPASKMIEVDERMIPTGGLTTYEYFKDNRLINKAVLDNGFKLNAISGEAAVFFSNQNIRLKYWQETGERKYNFLQVYTPAHRQSIAIEPMTCNINAFDNGDGLVILKPEMSVEVTCGILIDLKES